MNDNSEQPNAPGTTMIQIIKYNDPRIILENVSKYRCENVDPLLEVNVALNQKL